MDQLNKEIEIPLSLNDRLRIRVKTKPGERPTYAIQLECWFEPVGRWRQVIRADDFDGAPHLDIHHPDGTTEKKWLPDQGDNKMNMKAAEQFLRNHWKEQRKRYEDELHGN